MSHYKIKPLNSELFWFNYRTGAIGLLSEYRQRPSNNWRLVQSSSYLFHTQEEKDRLLSEADIVFKLCETEEERIRYSLKHGFEKNRLIGYAVKKNLETNNFDSLHF